MTPVLFSQLAIRNVVRNPRRTFLSVAAIIAGVAVLVLGRALIGGLEENIIRAQVDALSGHVLIRPADYPTVGVQHPLDGVFAVSPELSGWLDSNAKNWTTRTMFAPRLVHGAEAMRVRAIGFDLDRDATVFPRDTWHFEPENPPTDGLWLAKNVARILGVKPGDTVMMEGRTPGGAINALELPIAAIYTAGNSALDRGAIFVPGPIATEFLTEDRVSHVIFTLNDRELAPEAAAQVAAIAPPGTKTATWQDETHDMLELQKIRRRALDLLVLGLMGMSATGIANTVLMAAYERIREIGTLRAMGMTRAGVVALFVAEGGLMGALGGAIGVVLSASLVRYGQVHGIDLSQNLEQAGNLAFSTMLYLRFEPQIILMAFLFGLGVASAASVWPALIASRMQPADAVRAD